MPEYVVKESVGAGRATRGLRRVAPFLAIAVVLGRVLQAFQDAEPGVDRGDVDGGLVAHGELVVACG